MRDQFDAWLPGLNDKVCWTSLVKSGTRVAVALAKDVDFERFDPIALTLNCPMDDGTAARLYFAHRTVPSNALMRLPQAVSGSQHQAQELDNRRVNSGAISRL